MTPRLVAAVAGVGLGLAVGSCRVPNLDHCVHRASDADAWCRQAFDLPFCSPCEAQRDGCVTDEPLSCEHYEAPGTTGPTGGGSTGGATGAITAGTGQTETGSSSG